MASILKILLGKSVQNLNIKVNRSWPVKQKQAEMLAIYFEREKKWIR